MKRQSHQHASPFHCHVPVRTIQRAEFDRLSHQIMEHVFASQNELGRLCDEDMYETDLALRLQAAGLGPVIRQAPLTARWRDFAKTYYLDLIVQEAFVCELKAEKALVSEHESQLLNYLFLLDMPHGKLINFGSRSVEYRTINAVVPAGERLKFQLHTNRWQPVSDRCALLLETLTELLTAWGAFLDVHLYEEALIHFLGGKNAVMKSVPLSRADFPLGTKMLPALTEQVGLQLTALPLAAANSYEQQLRRFLALTSWTRLHWINLHHHDIHLVTLE